MLPNHNHLNSIIVVKLSIKIIMTKDVETLDRETAMPEKFDKKVCRGANANCHHQHRSKTNNGPPNNYFLVHRQFKCGKMHSSLQPLPIRGEILLYFWGCQNFKIFNKQCVQVGNVWIDFVSEWQPRHQPTMSTSSTRLTARRLLFRFRSIDEKPKISKKIESLFICLLFVPTLVQQSAKHCTWLRFLLLLWIFSLVYFVAAPAQMFSV